MSAYFEEAKIRFSINNIKIHTNQEVFIVMKKKIANAVQLVLLIASFGILNLRNITVIGNSVFSQPYEVSAISLIEKFPMFFIPMCALFLLCAVMCIISIISKSTYKDGKAHGAVAIVLFVVTVFNLITCTQGGKELSVISSEKFPGIIVIGLLFAVIVVAFAKRSSFIADSKESQQTVVNNIQETTNADELKKYKDLLDSGAITQEEFENKKKELLGL